MKISLKMVAAVVLTFGFAMGSGTSHSSTMLQDSSQGRPFPIVLSYQYWSATQNAPPSPPLNVYFRLDAVTPGSLLGAWTAFYDQLVSTSTVQSYIDGINTPPLLHAGDFIYMSDGVNFSLMASVQQYLSGGGNSKVLLPVVVGAGNPGLQPGPYPITGFVGFQIDGTNSYQYLYGHFNDPPVIGGTPPSSVAPGSDYVFVPMAIDADGDPLIFGIGNKPPWTGFNPITGMLSGTPCPSDVGSYDNIVVSVSDGGFTAALPPFSITVTPSPVKMTSPGQPDQYFNTPAAAIAAISAGSEYTIMCQGVEFAGDLTLSQCDTTVNFSGGYDSLFASRSGTTTNDGAVEVSCGALVVDGLVVGGNLAP